jgi:signal transduction histidine kinase
MNFNMHVRVKNTINELPILIICDNAEVAYQVTKQADFAAYNAILTTPLNDAQHLLERVRPQVIIAIDDSDSTLDLFQTLVSDVERSDRPILISVSDTPSNNVFSVADQVIPISYLPHIGQIIAIHLERVQKAALQEKKFAALEAHNLQLGQELVVAIRKSAEISLLKQTIIHSVSHELRTPMLQVKSAVALLNEDEHTNRTVMELAMEATTRLEGGIRNVTLLNELMNESSDAQTFSAVPIIQIVQAAIRNLGRSWERKKEIGRVEIISANNDYTVLCDKQRMTIAIQLLLDNALKFSQDKVTVAVTQHSKKVTVSIRDHGIGIPQDQITHIFEPFYQIDGSSTRRFGGMGIGLAIVRLIMDQHRTTIRLKSKVGKGSTFAFDLQSPED